MTDEQKPETVASTDQLGPLPDPAHMTPMLGCLYNKGQMHAYALRAVAAERERCARLCEDIGDGYQAREAYKWAELKTDAQSGAHDCAAAIRQAPSGEKP